MKKLLSLLLALLTVVAMLPLSAMAETAYEPVEVQIGDRTLTFTEEHIHDENPDLITTCPYHTVERLILCRGAVYVFFSAMQAFILPESAFSGDEERQALLNFLKEKTQKAVEVWE